MTVQRRRGSVLERREIFIAEIARENDYAALSIGRAAAGTIQRCSGLTVDSREA